MDISSIKMKNKFEESDIEYESCKSYVDMAKKLISTIAPRFKIGLAEEILKDEDAVSNIVTEIILADYKWNGLGTKHGYRKQRATWAIQSYMSRSKNKIKNREWSLEYTNSDDSISLREIIEDKKPGPHQKLEEKERASLVEDLLSSGILSKQQEKCIRLHYFDNLTQTEIGQQEGISREAVRQLLNRGLERLRVVANA